MEAKDLMIGDWVKFPIGIDKIVDIIYVVGRGLCASFAASATLFPVEISKLKPIPLTPEILEKNGFSEVAKRKWVLGDEYTGDEVLVLYEVANAFAMTTEGMNIGFQSVHELQHLFRLCGIEKEIEL